MSVSCGSPPVPVAAPAKGEISRNGAMKQTCISPIAIALLVSWNIQMVRAKPVMLLARTEIICPSQTREKPAMPAGRLATSCVFDLDMSDLAFKPPAAHL